MISTSIASRTVYLAARQHEGRRHAAAVTSVLTFKDLGFSGAEIETRAHAFKATIEAESVRFQAKRRAERERYLRTLFEFFTAR